MVQEANDALTWAVEARSLIQQQLLELYKIGSQNKTDLEKPNNQNTRSSYTRLVGVAFSLWRAAFLCEMDRSVPKIVHTSRGGGFSSRYTERSTKVGS